MSGIGFSEFLILCMIGLIVLGPKRLPRVANQIGTWVGQARRMTRVMRRQLEEELDFDRELNIKPSIHPASSGTAPRDDDTYSPLHAQPPGASVATEDGNDLDTNDDAGADNGSDDKIRDDSDTKHNMGASGEAAAVSEPDEAGGEQRRDT